MKGKSTTLGIEVNATQIGALFTNSDGEEIRIFCYYQNGSISQFNVPAQENMENLRQLFDNMKMEITCTSFILPEAVQGRVFMNQGGHVRLYTILKTPGPAAPLNADIANLEWQSVWKCPDTEVLCYNSPGGTGRSYAIRSEIKDDDAARLMQSSRAFCSPASPRFKPARQGGLTYVLLTLVCLSVIISATACFKGHSESSAAAPRISTATTGAPAANGYFLMSGHRINGPYPGKVVTDLASAGLINNDAMCRAEGSTDWIKISDLLATAAPAK